MAVNLYWPVGRFASNGIFPNQFILLFVHFVASGLGLRLFFFPGTLHSFGYAFADTSSIILSFGPALYKMAMVHLQVLMCSQWREQRVAGHFEREVASDPH